MKLMLKPLAALLAISIVACGGQAEDNRSSSNGDGDAVSPGDGDGTPEPGDGDEDVQTNPAIIGPGDGDGDGDVVLIVVPGDGDGDSMGGAPGNGNGDGDGDGGDGDWVVAPPPQTVEPGLEGNVAESCGAILTMDVELGPIDCTAHGDDMSQCVFGNHCWCSEGFVCAEQVDNPVVDQECPERVACVPAE